MLFIGFVCFSCGNAPPQQELAETEEELTFHLPSVEEVLPISEFREIWAYVLVGEENTLKQGMAISDIGYFGAEIDTYGTLVNIPNRKKLSAFPGKVHLVVACNGGALSYFTLRSGSAERKKLISDLLDAVKEYDGLQIDFEVVPRRSAADYQSFLRELKAGLPPNKMFTVSLAARTKKIDNDVYDYAKILPTVDRILVMAYDEHWSTSVPGPVASMRWCRNVAEYSLNVIGKEKLIMGIPFYGRAWARPNHSRAYYHVGVQRIARENNVTEISRVEGIPTFDYTTPVSVKVYYDDAYSLSVRMEMYRSMGIDAIGFWCLGQETPDVWNIIEVVR